MGWQLVLCGCAPLTFFLFSQTLARHVPCHLSLHMQHLIQIRLAPILHVSTMFPLTNSLLCCCSLYVCSRTWPRTWASLDWSGRFWFSHSVFSCLVPRMELSVLPLPIIPVLVGMTSQCKRGPLGGSYVLISNRSGRYIQVIQLEA